MSELEIIGFMKQIEANPEDLFLREVFGDWLEENGYDREDAWGFPLVISWSFRYDVSGYGAGVAFEGYGGGRGKAVTTKTSLGFGKGYTHAGVG